MPYWNRRRKGITFVFKSEPGHDDMAHIWARHRKTEDQAINVWFDFIEERWNDEHKRFESFTETEGIHWYWIDEYKQVVMISSCFDRRDGE